MTIYSYSRLSCYEPCMKKYKFQYIDKIKIEAKETIELFLGKRVHETLTKLYHDRQYQKETTLNELLDYFNYKWAKKWNTSIEIVKKEHPPEDHLKMAERCIIDYYNRYKPFNHGKTIALEEHILINLDKSDNYKLCGYIDRLTEAEDGCYNIHDYKTCSQLPSLETIENNRQLALYSIGVKQRYPHAKDVRLVWHFLKLGKEITSTRTDEELEELKQNTIRLIY